MLKTTPFKTCDILPKPQVQASQFPLHISYFLQNCKKANPVKWICPFFKNDITGSELALKYGIHSRYQSLRGDNLKPKSQALGDRLYAR